MKWYRLYKESSDSDFVIKNGVLEKYTGENIDVVIPNGVSEIGKAAFSCNRGIKSVVIPDSVIKIGSNAFCNCRELQNVKIGNGVQSIDYAAFCYCIKLTNITIPESVERIDGLAFMDCSSLSKVVIKNPEISFGKQVFDGCPLKVDPSNKILSKAFLFGISGLEVSHVDDSQLPDHVKFNGKQHSITDLGITISHRTIKCPLNYYGSAPYYRGLCRARKANPELFKKTMMKILMGKKINSWWDDTTEKWETNEKVLTKKNREHDNWQRNADMMNGL